MSLAVKFASKNVFEQARKGLVDPEQARKGVTVYFPRRETLAEDLTDVTQAASAFSSGKDIKGDIPVADGVGLRFDLAVDPGVDISIDQSIEMYWAAKETDNDARKFLQKTVATTHFPSQFKVDSVADLYGDVDPEFKLLTSDGRRTQADMGAATRWVGGYIATVKALGNSPVAYEKAWEVAKKCAQDRNISISEQMRAEVGISIKRSSFRAERTAAVHI